MERRGRRNFVVPAVDYVMTMHGGIKKMRILQRSCAELYKALNPAAGRGGVIHARIDRKNFRREVLEAKKPVLVEFYALWMREMR